MAQIFLDTNVLAYRFDDRDPEKQRIARAIDPVAHTYCVSTQVLLELASFLTRKRLPAFSFEQVAQVVEALGRGVVVPADQALVVRAVRTAGQHLLSIWDAMIVEAAVDAGCDELWTEDLTAGAVIRGVCIVNPFSSSAEGV